MFSLDMRGQFHPSNMEQARRALASLPDLSGDPADASPAPADDTTGQQSADLVSLPGTGTAVVQFDDGSGATPIVCVMGYEIGTSGDVPTMYLFPSTSPQAAPAAASAPMTPDDAHRARYGDPVSSRVRVS